MKIASAVKLKPLFYEKISIFPRENESPCSKREIRAKANKFRSIEFLLIRTFFYLHL